MPTPFLDALGIRLIPIEAGAFDMGGEKSPEETAYRYGGAPDWFTHEHPVRGVTISRPFFMSSTLITRGQFARFVEDAKYVTAAERDGGATTWTGEKFGKSPGLSWRDAGFEQTDDHPAVCIAWTDAKAFCDWASAKDHVRVRLPTEAEWEYACRAGKSEAYVWGDNPKGGAGWANVADQTAKERYAGWLAFDWSDGFVFTSPVARFRPNAWGLYDMAGNAWEWCGDWYGPYPNESATDPTGPDSGELRVIRGSAWFGAPCSSRCAFRNRIKPEYHGTNVGFRIVVEISS